MRQTPGSALIYNQDPPERELRHGGVAGYERPNLFHDFEPSFERYTRKGLA